jgi:hypothetical protein
MANSDNAGPSDIHLPYPSDVWRQVRYDLFETKDVQDNPTYSYAWIADQGGHFSLGFLPSYLFSWIAMILWGYDFERNIWIAVGVFGIWVFKELNDLRLAWRNARRSQSDFKFNFYELLLNIGTAWLFFAMGSAVAALSFWNTTYAVLSLVPVALITVRVSYWWLRRKITFQQANLPYLYRLATFPNNIPKMPHVGMGLDEAVAFVTTMIDPESKADPESKTDSKAPWTGHLILSGVPDAGKSTLAVAVGTEFVFKLGLARYLSMVKLLQFSSPQKAPTSAVAPREMRVDEEFDDGRVLWRWDRVQLLIVDDVDDIARVQHDDKPNPTPEEVKAFNDRVKQVLEARFQDILEPLRTRPRTIWVCNNPVNPVGLKKILEDILGYKNMQIIHLEKTIEEVRAEKRLPCPTHVPSPEPTTTK